MSNENNVPALIGELNQAFVAFKDRHDADVKELRDAVDDMAVKAAAAQMGGQPVNTTEAPADGVRSLRTFADFRAHYAQGVSVRDANDAVPMAEFLRGVAGMKTSERAVKALSEGTDSAGGYAVPNIVMPRILDAMTPASSLL